MDYVYPGIPDVVGSLTNALNTITQSLQAANTLKAREKMAAEDLQRQKEAFAEQKRQFDERMKIEQAAADLRKARAEEDVRHNKAMEEVAAKRAGTAAERVAKLNAATQQSARKAYLEAGALVKQMESPFPEVSFLSPTEAQQRLSSKMSAYDRAKTEGGGFMYAEHQKQLALGKPGIPLFADMERDLEQLRQGILERNQKNAAILQQRYPLLSEEAMDIGEMDRMGLKTAMPTEPETPKISALQAALEPNLALDEIRKSREKFVGDLRVAKSGGTLAAFRIQYKNRLKQLLMQIKKDSPSPKEESQVLADQLLSELGDDAVVLMDEAVAELQDAMKQSKEPK